VLGCGRQLPFAIPIEPIRHQQNRSILAEHPARPKPIEFFQTGADARPPLPVIDLLIRQTHRHIRVA
jgi:hypothetical protein